MMHEDLSEHGSSYDGPGTQTSKLDWRRAHEELSRLARYRAGLDWQEGRSLLDALRCGAHLHLGFGSFGEYIERLFGYTRRSTEERQRVAEAFEPTWAPRACRPSCGRLLRCWRRSCHDGQYETSSDGHSVESKLREAPALSSP